MRVLALIALVGLIFSGCWTSKTTTTETSHQQTVTPAPIVAKTTRAYVMQLSENCQAKIDSAVRQTANLYMEMKTANGSVRVRLVTENDSLTRYADSLRHVRRWKQTLGVVAVPKDTSVKIPEKTVTIEKTPTDTALFFLSAKYWSSVGLLCLLLGFAVGRFKR